MKIKAEKPKGKNPPSIRVNCPFFGFYPLPFPPLKDLPDDFSPKDSILELVYGLLATLEAKQRKSQKIEAEDKELIMSLRTVFREQLAQQKQEGIQEGMQQSIQQGLQKEINLVIRLLTSKIGDLAPELERQVRNLSLDKLEDLGLALLQFNSVEDLIAWLQTN
jgi:flagellar biosynthesis/type III secretory pathway protein FliH